MINKEKILVVTSSYPMFAGDVNGGFVHELAKRLTTDFEVFVLAPWQKNLAKKETIDDVKIIRHKQFFWDVDLAYGIGLFEKLKSNPLKYLVIPFYFIFQLLSIKQIVRKEQINVIHAHWLIPNGFIAVLYKILFNKKNNIICTIHGSDFWGINNNIGKFLKQFTLKHISKLTVVSNALKDAVLKFGYKKNIYVYPMGVDTYVFSPDKKDLVLKEKLNISGFFLLFVGAIVEAKGIRHLIEAMPLVLEKHPDTKLLVVGDGNLKNEMIELVKDLNLPENIIFTGAIPHNDLPHYFATADLFILPSFSEGFGLVIIEAMSCETLVIASKLPVIYDIITEGKTGFFFSEINKYAISEKIKFKLINLSTFNNIKENGRKHVFESFDWKKVSLKYKNLINQLINKT